MPRKERSGVEWTVEVHQALIEVLFKQARRTKVPKSLMEEAMQEAILMIARQWDSLRGPDKLQRLFALGRKVFHDIAVDLLRRRDRQRAASLNDMQEEPVDGKAHSPLTWLLANEQPEWLRSMLEKLRRQQPQYAWLLSEHYLKERPLEELAAERETSKHALEMQKTRALKALRRLLEKHGIDGEFFRD